jgi:hypothetical protein
MIDYNSIMTIALGVFSGLILFHTFRVCIYLITGSKTIGMITSSGLHEIKQQLESVDSRLSNLENYAGLIHNEYEDVNSK